MVVIQSYMEIGCVSAKRGGENGVSIGMGFPLKKKGTMENTPLAIIIILIKIIKMEFLELAPICSEPDAL